MMELRRFVKAGNTNLLNNTKLLRRFDSKNFVKIDQGLVNSIDALQTVKKEPTNSSFKSWASPSKPLWDIKSARSKASIKTIRSSSSAYSLRSSRRLSRKIVAEEQSEVSEILEGITIKSEPIDYDSIFNLNSIAKSNIDNESARNFFETLVNNATVHKSVSKSPTPPLKRQRVNEHSFPTMSAIDGRTARYGWIIQDYNSVPVIQKEDPNFAIDDPDDYVCFNEKKTWAGSFAVCLGQKNLCKWL